MPLEELIEEVAVHRTEVPPTAAFLDPCERRTVSGSPLAGELRRLDLR